MTPEQLHTLNAFLNGIIAMGHLTAALFFLRFWKKTVDRLFAMFGVAFFLLGVVRVVFVILGDPGEEHYVYWFRLLAYLIILAAIVDKNWRK